MARPIYLCKPGRLQGEEIHFWRLIGYKHTPLGVLQVGNVECSLPNIRSCLPDKDARLVVLSSVRKKSAMTRC